MPFSLQFFLIGVIFLFCFYVEITLVSSKKKCNPMTFISATIFSLIVLLLSLYHEWNQGALTWAT